MSLTNLVSLGLEARQRAIAILLEAVGDEGHSQVRLIIDSVKLDLIELGLKQLLGSDDERLERKRATNNEHVVLLSARGSSWLGLLARLDLCFLGLGVRYLGNLRLGSRSGSCGSFFLVTVVSAHSKIVFYFYIFDPIVCLNKVT